MEHLSFFAVALFILAFGAISRRIETTAITPPMLFVLFGYLIGPGALNLIHMEKDHHLIHLLAELTLVLVLFTDASRIDVTRLRKEHDIPVRMLALGLPMCMLFGALVALPLFPELDFWNAMVLAIVLAPTDAALGQAVVSSERVPIRIRQALNVESGLNDGFALPVLLFFLCLAMHVESGHDNNFLKLAFLQLTLGPIAGIAIGYLGGKLVDWGHHSGWMSHAFIGLSSLGLALLSFAGAELIGGNGFIAAFCAGAALGNTLREPCEALVEFGEAEGQLLTLLTFLFFGALMVPPALPHIDLQTVVYAVLSLTAIRMIPTMISLWGMKLRPATIGFLGWFGPRGVASIIYGLLLLEEAELQHRHMLFNVTVIVVLVSVIAHGLSAWPGVQWYGGHIEQGPQAAEHKTVHHIPFRLGNKK
ncbi:Cation:proton antiporter [Sulfidibacter corallicola]|uniref:Cation:proton antiporter n=1 Tax=Sulfidibacter corallicola TaxID=2818388 RepID=A0A8A4TJ37_SULCO|nr:cation:proton antiporter [Sulfidibacter corallicola]QTD49497.1 cation:proton antiporter [Sulfidibacter corallicola]